MSRSGVAAEPLPVADRLAKLETELRKATDEALKQQHAAPPSGTTPSYLQDTNASFLLGMELFGQEVGTLERSIQEKLTELESELTNIVDSLKLSTNENAPLENEEEFTADPDRKLDPTYYEQQEEVLRQHIQFLKDCSVAREQLDESITHSQSSPTLDTSSDVWVKAAQTLILANQSLTQAQATLEAASSSPSSSESAGETALATGQTLLDSIRNAIRRQRNELLVKVTGILETSIQISTTEISVKNSTQLDQAYQVLETLGSDGQSALSEALRTLGQSLLDQVILPVVNAFSQNKASATPWTTTEREDKPTSSLVGVTTTSKKAPIHVLEWSQSTAADDIMEEPVIAKTKDELMEAWKVALEFLTTVLTFFQKRVLLEKESLSRMVGNRLFGKPEALPSNLQLEALGLQSTLLGGDKGILLETILARFEETCLPDYLEPSELQTLEPMGKTLLSAVVPFCRAMTTLSLMSSDKKSPPKLIDFCQRFQQNYVEHRRCVLLNQARAILLKNDYHNTVTVGEDGPIKELDEGGLSVFRLHKSSISDTSSKLMQLVRATMDEAASLPPQEDESAPLSLFGPTLYRTARESLNLFRAIIPAKYGREVAQVPRTAAVLHNDCVYLAHHCLTLGLEYKEKFPETDQARGKLLKQTCIFVDMVPLFRELADRAMGDMLEMQKNQLAEIVGSRITYLGKALASDDSLQEWSEAETALAAGLYHLRHLAQAWDPILSKDVFGRSIGYLADALFTLYLNQVHQAIDISASACHFACALFSKATEEISTLMHGNTQGSQVWEHFDAVGRFMAMNLAEIEAALADGVFRQVGAQELMRLIEGTFSDSPRRRALLHTLSNV